MHLVNILMLITNMPQHVRSFNCLKYVYVTELQYIFEVSKRIIIFTILQQM